MRKFFAVGVTIALLCLGGASFAAADTLEYYIQGSTVNLAGPAYDWWYGCSPTSAGMMMGYYDIHGYGGQSYANLVPGYTAENSTFPISSTIQTNTYMVNNIIATTQYVTNFYRDANGNPGYTNGGNNAAYGVSGDDVATSQTFNCLAYYMGTSQDAAGNSNGSTGFYYWSSGAKFYAKNAVGLHDGMLGMDEYFRSCGYGTGSLSTDTNFYTQLIYNSATAPLGFTFADYKAKIDAGQVMMIQLKGHSMFGYGYTDAGQIIFRDTWNGLEHYMDWGGSYSGMAQWGVVGFDPTGGSPVPLPGAVWLLGSGLVGLWGARRRWSNS